MNPWNVGPTDLGVSSSMLTKSMKIPPDCKYDLENAQVLELCRGLLEVSNYYEKSSS